MYTNISYSLLYSHTLQYIEKYRAGFTYIEIMYYVIYGIIFRLNASFWFCVYVFQIPSTVVVLLKLWSDWSSLHWWAWLLLLFWFMTSDLREES